MKPRLPITDRRFKYTPSAHTDIRSTFQRIRREQEQKTPAVVNITERKTRAR